MKSDFSIPACCRRSGHGGHLCAQRPGQGDVTVHVSARPPRLCPSHSLGRALSWSARPHVHAYHTPPREWREGHVHTDQSKGPRQTGHSDMDPETGRWVEWSFHYRVVWWLPCFYFISVHTHFGEWMKGGGGGGAAGTINSSGIFVKIVTLHKKKKRRSRRMKRTRRKKHTLLFFTTQKNSLVHRTSYKFLARLQFRLQRGWMWRGAKPTKYAYMLLCSSYTYHKTIGKIDFL